MFIAAYWWKVHPGKEAQFRAAWRRGTELIRARYGSLGSRLHRDACAEGPARFIGSAGFSRTFREPIAILSLRGIVSAHGAQRRTPHFSYRKRSTA